MIEFKNVTKYYSELTALENINLTINDGEIFGIVGQSGAGKSTLLRTINKLEDIDSGEIIVNGQEITSLKGKDLREYRKEVTMIFQHFSLLDTLTIYDNIALPLQCAKWKKEAIKERVLELAKIVDIIDQLEKLPSQLSGGQKQRAAIARSLALYPKVLLCDEATSALDPITTKSILNLLLKINKELNITIVIVTHQMEVVKEVCERIAILNKGKLLEVGQTEDLFLSSNEALKTIVSEEEILPDKGVNIRIYFPRSSTGDSFITKMARELNIDFSIVWGKLEKFQDNVLGSLVINIDEKLKVTVINYLNKNNQRYEVL